MRLAKARAPTPCVGAVEEEQPRPGRDDCAKALHDEGADVVADEACSGDAELVHQGSDIVGQHIGANLVGASGVHLVAPLSPKPLKSGAISRWLSPRRSNIGSQVAW